MQINILLILVLFSNLVLAGSDNILPGKVSDLDGWHGLQIKYGARCPKCPDLIFPENFGVQNDKELMIIKELINNRRKMDVDLEHIPPVSYYALDHLVYIATEKKDIDAAKLILRGQYTGDIKVDGELAEEYAIDRIVPVLKEMPQAPSLVNKCLSVEQKKNLAEYICERAAANGELQEMYQLSSNLKKSGEKILSHEIEVQCKERDFDYWIQQEPEPKVQEPFKPFKE